MPNPVLTETLARAAATDAANRQMRHAGRIHWNRDDLRLCAQTLDRLCPLSPPLEPAE